MTHEEKCKACKKSSTDAFQQIISEYKRGPAKSRLECPPDTAELGRATWTYLHTLAAYYPEKPSSTRQQNTANFLKTFAWTYPCADCAQHMRVHLKTHPADTSSRAAFSWWACELHNEVNRRLGKPLFDCGKTDERWRTGPADGSCD